MKINFKKLNQWIYIITTLIIIAIIMYAGIFLYFNFYRTITQTDEVITLRKDVPIEYLDIKRVNQIIERVEKKITPSETRDAENLF